MKAVSKNILLAEAKYAIRRSRMAYLMLKFIAGEIDHSYWVNASHDLFITSWGRSGTTYMTMFVRRAYPKLKVASHGHTIAALKQAMRKRTPILIGIREPQEVVTSMLVKQAYLLPSDKIARSRLLAKDYYLYHQFILEHLQDMCVVSAESVFNKPELLFDLLWRFGFQPEDRIDRTAVASEVYKELDSDTRSPLARQLDSDEKSEAKKEQLEYLSTESWFVRASETYHELTERIQ